MSDNSNYYDRVTLLREGLVDQYGKYYSKDILNQYDLHEKQIIVNDNDPDLYPIPLDLPTPPEYHLIDGFGLPKEQQYFRPPEIPKKLNELLKRLGKKASVATIWETLDRNRTAYASEIRWINMQWGLRKNGYWFFNYGIPTYIDGWHWLYMSYWNLDIGLPQYRYRDRMFFLFARYCYTTTTAPFYYRFYDHDFEDYRYFSTKIEAEQAISDKKLLCTPEHGDYIVDFGRRTCYGFNYPKHRREGATYKGAMMNYEIISSLRSAHGGIQSKDEKSAENDVFKNAILNPFKKLPFFFKPIHKNSFAEELLFDYTIAASGNGGFAGHEQGLESKISYKAAGERQYDGSKLFYHHGDEEGKDGEKPINQILRWNVVMKCLAQGTNIHGLAVKTSTVSDTTGNGGRNFMQLCKMSKYEYRNPANGRTSSGLLNLFIPATINYDGFTDPYGNPIVSRPTLEQRKFIGNTLGSEEFLESELKARAGDPISYYEQLREFPSKFRHAFLSAGKDSGFNLMVLSDRMAELDMHDELAPRIGNFKWIEKFGGDVKFVDDPNGKWILSYVPANPNNHITKNGKKAPANTHLFVSSADPFKFENTKGGKKSNGGGCVFLKHDNLLDPLSKETKLWFTKRTVCTYNNRVDLKETYKEDMLMQSMYFGTKIFPENNVNDIYEYFKLHGFEEYLQYQIINGVREANPGFYSSLEMKQRMFALVMDYIENHGMAERHREILQECYDIKGLEDMTNHDLFTAFGGCMLAIYYEEKARPTQQLAEGEVDPMVKYILGIS